MQGNARFHGRASPSIPKEYGDPLELLLEELHEAFEKLGKDFAAMTEPESAGQDQGEP